MTNTSIWFDLWKDLVSSIEKGTPDFELYNPRILIDDIIDELDFNNFTNLENRKFFYDKLSFYLLTDKVIIEDFHTSFKLLRRDFNQDRLNYIREICNEIKQSFSEGRYFGKIVNLLKPLLLSDSEITINEHNQLKYISISLIIEFLKKGYSSRDIKDFANNIFDGYSYPIKGLISTKFPHGIDERASMIKNGKLHSKVFSAEVQRTIDNLSVEDRIDALSYYFSRPREKAFYLFVVEGIKISEVFTIGEVTFYTSELKRFLKEYPFEGDFDNVSEKPHSRVAVEIEYLMPESSLQEAMRKVENTFDLIACYYNIKTELKLLPTSWAIADLDGNGITHTFKRGDDDKFTKERNSFDSSIVVKKVSKFTEYISMMSRSNEAGSQAKLANSLHWYRKGEQSRKQEDKILNFWIALENLFFIDKDISNDILTTNRKKKIHLIQECVSEAYAIVSVHDLGWELYYHYANQTVIKRMYKSSNLNYDFSDDLISRAQLDPKAGSSIHLKNFIDCLDEIRNEEKQLIFINQIDELQRLYKDPKVLRKYLETEMGTIKNNVLMLYRYRNMIVHNAHFESMMLPYYAQILKEYSGFMIRLFLNKYNDSGMSLANILLKNHVKKEKIMSDLEEGKIFLFDDKYK